MIYTSKYKSPMGDLLLASKNNELIGMWFINQKYYLSNIKEEMTEKDDEPIIEKTKKWLNRYFKKQEPQANEIKINPVGSEFQKLVWKLLCEIPYGSTTTYKEIALKVAKIKGLKHMSSQAVGGAVSRNPISIIIPCHRVIGTNGKLTGYAGGLDKKTELLKIENIIK